MPVIHRYKDSELGNLIEKEILIREQFDDYLNTHETEISVQYFINNKSELVFILEITID